MCKPLSNYFANCRPAGIWFSILFFLVTIPLSAQTSTPVVDSDLNGDGDLVTMVSLNDLRGVVPNSLGNFYTIDEYDQPTHRVSSLANGSLAITGVTGLICTPDNANRYTISFSPTYSGATGDPISFSVVNEMLPTTSPGPYSLQLYTDNPIIQMRAVQAGSSASYAYNWVAACSTPPLSPPVFSIADVTGVSCTSLSATSRRLSFTPVYSGATGAPISFSVVNEMLPTTSPGPIP